MAPHSMTLTMVGASILWVGWFGFNAGSALSAGGGAALAMMNTFVATAGAVAGLVGARGDVRGKASMLGAASGMVAGLVAVTPAAGFVGPVGAIVLGSSPRAAATSSCRWSRSTSATTTASTSSASTASAASSARSLTGFFASTVARRRRLCRRRDDGRRRSSPRSRRSASPSSGAACVLHPLQAGRHDRRPAGRAGDRARGAGPGGARRARLRLLRRGRPRVPARPRQPARSGGPGMRTTR